MQRCVGLPGVGRPAGDTFRRRATRARPQILKGLQHNGTTFEKMSYFFSTQQQHKVLEGQNMVIRVVTRMVIHMVIRMIICMVILYGYEVLKGPH